MRNFLISVTRNPLSLLGSVITTVSAIVILTLFGLELVGFHGGPYTGIVAFLILPGFFVFGLALIPLGVLRHKRLARLAMDRGEPAPTFPVIDLNLGRTRRIVLIALAATVVNVIIVAMATYKGVEVLDSTEFCGTTCHTLMSPEFTTYQRSPHARVKCVSCHIGPGANWFVKSKLSGTWQVVSVALELYPKPIPTPVHNLRPARDTCEQCHWPTKFVGDRLKVLTRYAEDEENTELKTVLVLKIGGQDGLNSHGIHWHVDPANEIRYRADETRETIYDVELSQADGTVTTYRTSEPPEDAEGLHWRTMDCVDCHNRPTHIYRLPTEELDAAMESGRIDPTLPFIRREGLRALEVEYGSHDEARRGIEEQIASFYSEEYPDLAASDSEKLGEAAARISEIYATNVFPPMKITWGTYPNHIGHQNTPGCFRCHDEEHATDEGDVISQDCFTCHTLLAMEEEDPDILADLQP